MVPSFLTLEQAKKVAGSFAVVTVVLINTRSTISTSFAFSEFNNHFIRLVSTC